MKNFQRKKKKVNLLHSKPVMLLFILILLVLAWSVIGLVGKATDTFKNKKIAQEKIEQLREQKKNLLSNIEKLSTEKGVEENIRDKFGLAKEGEGLVVITENKDSKEEEGAKGSENKFWSFLQNWFK